MDYSISVNGLFTDNGDRYEYNFKNLKEDWFNIEKQELEIIEFLSNGKFGQALILKEKMFKYTKPLDDILDYGKEE